MIIVHAFLEVKDGMAKSFLDAVEKCVAETRKEPGCRFYTLYADAENPLKYVIVEEWDSKAALDVHMTLPHFLVLGESLKDVLSAPAVIKVFNAEQV